MDLKNLREVVKNSPGITPEGVVLLVESSLPYADDKCVNCPYYPKDEKPRKSRGKKDA